MAVWTLRPLPHQGQAEPQACAADPLDLGSDQGRQRWIDAARCVMSTHADVLAALARR